MEKQQVDSGQRVDVVRFENKAISRLRVAVALFSQAFHPVALRIYYIYLRQQQVVVENLRHRLLPAVIAFLANRLSTSLACVQKRISPVSRRTIRNLEEDLSSPIADDRSETNPEASVDCLVLFTPEEEIKADVIFIHGLHGGVDKTWKQGRWRHDGHKLKHQLLVRSNSSGDVHIPLRRNSLKRSLSDVCHESVPSKVARKENEVCVTNEQGWEEIFDHCEPEEEEEEEEEGEEGCFSNCWPQDWIPKDCPGARVIALNYTTDVLWCPVWKKKRKRTDMVERSDEMIQSLIEIGVGKKPIIWVGHSKGGLFIKQIIMNAWERHPHDLNIYEIFKNTKGIMFYSVPHKGSTLADVTLPLLRRSIELTEIQRNCDFVLDLHRRFLEVCEQEHLRADIFSFIETSFTLMSFVYLKIVAYESADPEIGFKCDVPLDHREICKPAARDCFLYLELIKLIRKHVTKA